MCSGRVDPIHVLEAFKSGADCVLVTGCHPGDCHYITGNYAAEKRVRFLKRVLSKIGIEPDRLKLEWISAAEGARFADLIKNTVNEFKDNPFIPDEPTLRRIDAALKAFKVGRFKSILGAILPMDAKIDEQKYMAAVEKVIENEVERYMD
jgi:coenzyme F420-reducing hydrogenase delta subunit